MELEVGERLGVGDEVSLGEEVGVTVTDGVDVGVGVAMVQDTTKIREIARSNMMADFLTHFI